MSRSKQNRTLPSSGARSIALACFIAALVVALPLVFAAQTVPTDIELPGTQPGEGPAISASCSCHYGTDTPEFEPGFGWEGGMMANAMKDPIFWATVAIAEQDFLPGADPTTRGGAGDLCLRCHGPAGWMAGRSEPTDGSLYAGDDDRGVECEHCHQMVNPDQPVNVVGTTEVQNSPFLAYDPDTGEGYYGSAMFVMNGVGERLGPYDDASANHAFLKSSFFREGEFCGTCHDVSNSAVGDLAHNFGAQLALPAGSYSGVPGAPAEQKAAFNNPPYAYGIVERTFSEWKASGLDTYRVDQYASLPSELQAAGGALQLAYNRAYDVAPPSANPNRPNFVDGDIRYYTCQTCHMSAATGKGCNKNQAPTRYDLGRHDFAGGGYWMPDVVKYQADNGLLRLGSVSTDQWTAMQDGKSRAAAWLTAAANLTAEQSGNQLQVRVVNLTGHKLISGYPEGRRMWLNIKWYDGGGALVHEDGAYGNIGRTVQDLDGTTHQVQSILDLDNTVIYQAKPAMDQQWATQLLALGYPSGMILEYDRMTDVGGTTLGDLAAESPGDKEPTFHFVLNNVLYSDNRIPPYGFRYDEAEERSCLPVPDTRFGDPGAGGTFNHWDDRYFNIPAGAERADVSLYYQQTSWEYVQFLWLENDGLGFLGSEGVNMLDAYLNTGQSTPLQMAFDTTPVSGQVTGVPGQASKPADHADQMLASLDAGSGAIDISYTPACDATDHTVYWGDLGNVSIYGYAGAECFVGTSGTASFDPGSGSYFFLVVGNDGTDEGSYGHHQIGGAIGERDEDVGTPTCDRTQNLAGVICE
jgi:hypothetical protein